MARPKGDTTRKPAPRSGRWSAALVAAALLGLLSLVTLAAGGGSPFDLGSSGRSSSGSDYVVTFALSLAAVAVAVTLYLIRPSGRFRHDRTGGHGLGWSLVALAIAVAIGIGILLAYGGGDGSRSQDSAQPPPRAGAAETRRRDDQPPAREVDFKWQAVLAVAVAASLAAAAAVAVARRRRRRTGPPRAADLAEELGVLLDLTLDDLRADPDARRAVVAAYARMERAFAAHGVPRRPCEAPHEYLQRLGDVLGEVPAAQRFAAELTRLYERAKFSEHEIEAAMKADAIAALESLRDELQDAREQDAA